MILIVSSTRDIASVNIANSLLSLYEFQRTTANFQGNPIYSKIIEGKEVKLVSINEDSIKAQYITDHFSPQLTVFISRHSGVAGIPTLSVHTPGNLGEAKFGGIPKRISVSPANAMKNALLKLEGIRQEKNLPYEVSYECTHHGPSLDVPTMFVELGSSIEQWKDLAAAEAVAHGAMAAVCAQSRHEVVIGIGGPHYNERFTRIALTTPRAFGHIVSKYNVSNLDTEMINQCVQKTLENVELAVFDWKSLKAEARGKIIGWLKELDIPFEKA